MKLSVSHKEIWQITHPIIFGNLAQTLIVLVNTIFSTGYCNYFLNWLLDCIP